MLRIMLRLVGAASLRVVSKQNTTLCAVQYFAAVLRLLAARAQTMRGQVEITEAEMTLPSGA
jgi:hypothetical protein